MDKRDNSCILKVKSEDWSVATYGNSTPDKRKKSKLVVNFKVLKKYVVCYTGNDITDMCNKTMKSW